MILQKLQAYALMLVAVILVLLGAYAVGGRAAKKAADKKQQFNDALRAAAGATGVHDAEIQVGKMPNGGAAADLKRDWMRGPEEK